jgi:hypothetical protein
MNGSSQLEYTRGVVKVMLIWYCFALKLTVVLDYYEAIETYSRIVLIRSYRILKSYLDYYSAKLWKLSVVLAHLEHIVG